MAEHGTALSNALNAHLAAKENWQEQEAAMVASSIEELAATRHAHRQELEAMQHTHDAELERQREAHQRSEEGLETRAREASASHQAELERLRAENASKLREHVEESERQQKQWKLTLFHAEEEVPILLLFWPVSVFVLCSAYSRIAEP